LCRDLAPILVTWGLRDYGIEGQVWSRAPACEHVWGEALAITGKVSHGQGGPG